MTAPREKTAVRRKETPFDEVLSGVREAISEDLTPNMYAIDVEGVYPESFMRRVGAVGGYSQGTPSALGGEGRGIGYTMRVMEETSKTCLSTGFCVWCHTVCGWYIQNGDSDYLKETLLPRVLSGESLAGTGLSNPMKHFAGIERMKVKAERRPGGYVLNGSIPWVSNVDKDHYFAVVAEAEGGDSYMMAVVSGRQEGLKLGHGGHFIALEGSSTYSVVFKDVFVPEEWILASPAQEYISRIRPGFILAQTGFGFGLVQSCLEIMEKANRRSDNKKSGVNGFIEDQVGDLEADLQAARREAYALAGEIGCGEEVTRADITADVVRSRIAASELSLRASRAAMLHMGAAGYRTGGATERKLRESYFVAIVTPALKHLKKVLHDMEQKEKAAS